MGQGVPRLLSKKTLMPKGYMCLVLHVYPQEAKLRKSWELHSCGNFFLLAPFQPLVNSKGKNLLSASPSEIFSTKCTFLLQKKTDDRFKTTFLKCL